MKVSCPTCDSKYNIADEKVVGRKVKVRCKSCGGQILVDGTAPAEASSLAAADSDENDATRVFSSAERDAFDAAQEDAGVTSALVSADAAEASAKPGELVWSVNVSETDERSMTTDELVAAKLRGELEGEVYVWHDGLTDWKLIADVPELAAAISAKRPAQTKATASRPQNAKPEASTKTQEVAQTQAKKALPTAGKTITTAAMAAKAKESPEAEKKSAARAATAKRPQSAHDLFAAATAKDTAEADVPVAQDEAADAKMTGARNESSVLFSLDALKAGIVTSPQPAAPKGPAGRKGPPAAPKKKLEDIMSTGTAAMPLAGPGPILMSTTQALLTAPAPPPPKPEPPKPYVSVAPSGAPAASSAPATAPTKKKTGLLLAVAAVVVLGSVGAIAMVVMGGDKSEKAEASAAPSLTVAAPTQTQEPVKAPEPPPSEEKPAQAVASAEPSAAPSAAPAAPTEVAAAAPATPKTETTKTETKTAEPKAEAKKTETKTETKKTETAAAAPAGGGATAPFSRDAAVQALSVAASQATSCKKPDGPTGTGKVQVTFAPSGRVTSANVVGGAFGGTPVGGCVSSVFRRARVPPFAGDPVTVAKSFTISP